VAWAADDLDSDGKVGKKSRNRAASAEQEIVREIERGIFVKSNVGSTSYLGTSGVPTASVIAVGLAVGQDFIDRERLSVSWEAQLHQSLINGPRLDELSAYPALIQGDLHVFNLVGAVEASTYPARRLGVGVKAGGGLSTIPLLMHPVAYQDEIVDGVWGVPASAHLSPLPVIVAGPTFEYYTKLSHFSLGADVDVSYTIGWDLGVSPSGYLKYTF
jgi:hypothetical protein